MNSPFIDQIADWDNLLSAHHKARKGKRYREEVMSFELNLWENLAALQMELLWGSYKPGRYREFMVYEPKQRQILAAPYRDRVAQHAICNICGPGWDKSMITDTYACRPGKGTHAGVNRLQKWLRGLDRQGEVWVLKMDLEKYFASIRHSLAKQVIRRKVECHTTLAVLDAIIDSTAASYDPEPVGIPVGNLVSQWVANLVGNEIDQWAKRELRARHYIRYMDDMIVLCKTKQEALQAQTAFADKIDRLGFSFSKYSILPSGRGINFLGYRIWPTHRLLRKDSIKKMRRKMPEIKRMIAEGGEQERRAKATVNSWLAHARHANSENIIKSVTM